MRTSPASRRWSPLVRALGLVAVAALSCSEASELAECATDEECGADLPRCHPTAGICVVDCSGGTPCPGGESCDAASGLCACSPTVQGCPGGRTCHVEDLVCVEPGCESGCPEGRTCCGGQCVVDASRCDQEGCTSDVQCLPDERCDTTQEPHACVPRA